jgi:predicted ATPase
VSAYTVRRWIREGRLPAEKRPSRYGNQFFVPASALTDRQADSTESTPPRQAEATAPQADVPVAVQIDAIVDRDSQLELLRSLLSSAAAGHGRVAIVSGDAGIGKTTIVRQCMRDAVSAGFQVASGHCYDLEATPPYGPWNDLARMLASNGGPTPDLTATLTSATVQEQHALVWSTIATRARQQPLLLVLEDMHWSDGPSVELLRVVARRVTTEPILLLVTHRDVDLAHDHPLFRLMPYLVREAGADRIPLRPFDREGVDRLLTERYALSRSDRAQLSQYLLRYAEGNPFFTAELLH